MLVRWSTGRPGRFARRLDLDELASRQRNVDSSGQLQFPLRHDSTHIETGGQTADRCGLDALPASRPARADSGLTRARQERNQNQNFVLRLLKQSSAEGYGRRKLPPSMRTQLSRQRTGQRAAARPQGHCQASGRFRARNKCARAAPRDNPRHASTSPRTFDKQQAPGGPVQSAAAASDGVEIISLNDLRVRKRKCVNYYARSPPTLVIIPSRSDASPRCLCV